MNMFKQTVSITGVGYVGLTLAMALSRVNVRVIGIDTSRKRLSDLKQGKAGIIEKGIEKLLKDSLESGTFLPVHPLDIKNELNTCSVHVITVGTPLVNGKMDDNALTSALGQISKHIKDGDLVVIRSTVSLGSSRRIVLPILEKTGKRFYLAMCPERTIEGNAIEEISSLPQIVGGLDGESSKLAAEFFSNLGCEVLELGSIEEAELVKLANNSFRDLTFAFSNELSSICTALEISSSKIISAANYKYPRSNIPVGGPASGPCLSKDPIILQQSAQSINVEAKLGIVAREINEILPLQFVTTKCLELFSKAGPRKVSLIGLSFKGEPAVIDTRNSFAVKLATWLHEEYGLISHGFEPAGEVDLLPEDRIKVMSLKDCLIDSDLVVFCHNSSYFINHVSEMTFELSPECTIIDMWGIFRNSEIIRRYKYFSWT